MYTTPRTLRHPRVPVVGIDRSSTSAPPTRQRKGEEPRTTELPTKSDRRGHPVSRWCTRTRPRKRNLHPGCRRRTPTPTHPPTKPELLRSRPSCGPTPEPEPVKTGRGTGREMETGGNTGTSASRLHETRHPVRRKEQGPTSTRSLEPLPWDGSRLNPHTETGPFPHWRTELPGSLRTHSSRTWSPRVISPKRE